MAEYSRRSFLKGSALVGAAGAMGLAAGCGTSGAGGFEGYVPGDYTAEVSGHNAPFTVKVSFTKHALGDIDASGSQESLGVGKSAIGTLSHAIVKSQSLACDAVTGASITSAALLQGVKDCASQAG
ncbi:twin-arginine translocation signal domain-containing protein, partial [Slackia exigua]